jgi:hypothetical protein
MAAATLNEALEIFGKLSAEEQEMMLEIARKRRIEAWRKARRDYRAGKLKSEPLEQLLKRLHKLADEEP